MPLSIVAAVAVSSPVLLASLQGRLEARTGIAAFVVALAGVWMLGAMGSRAVAALDRSVTRRRLGTTPGGPGRGDGGPVG
jgi:threonine/homoserine efflux transporter RhtA